MKYAVITGGSKGIGKAIAVQLAQDHQYHILFTYKNDDASADITQQEIEALGVHCESLKFDIADAEASQQAFSEWEATHPDAEIEVLVNNAGCTKDGLLMWMPKEDWDTVIQTSLNGFYNTTHFFLEKMLKQSYGRIINITSLSGAKGQAGQVNYSAAKAGLIGATKALAQEVAKRKVTVNAVAPGFIKSAMTQDLPEKELKKNIPTKRFGTPDEVAHLVSFLASPKASYITGELIHINGGLYS